MLTRSSPLANQYAGEERGQDEGGARPISVARAAKTPRDARAPDAYQIAHQRLHGRWPRRDRVERTTAASDT
jgi:hypothetical protein